MKFVLEEMQIDQSLGLTAEDIKKDLKGSLKRIVLDGCHMADVLADDYNQFENVTGKDPDEVIRRIYTTRLDAFRPAFPNMDDVDIVGYLFSEEFYSALKKRSKKLN